MYGEVVTYKLTDPGNEPRRPALSFVGGASVSHRSGPLVDASAALAVERTAQGIPDRLQTEGHRTLGRL